LGDKIAATRHIMKHNNPVYIINQFISNLNLHQLNSVLIGLRTNRKPDSSYIELTSHRYNMHAEGYSLISETSRIFHHYLLYRCM